MLGAVLTESARKVRRVLRPFFVSEAWDKAKGAMPRSPKHMFYDVCTWITSIIALDYCVGPFVCNEFWLGIQVWARASFLSFFSPLPLNPSFLFFLLFFLFVCFAGQFWQNFYFFVHILAIAALLALPGKPKEAKAPKGDAAASAAAAASPAGEKKQS